jgi:hypothetical protein
MPAEARAAQGRSRLVLSATARLSGAQPHQGDFRDARGAKRFVASVELDGAGERVHVSVSGWKKANGGNTGQGKCPSIPGKSGAVGRLGAGSG